MPSNTCYFEGTNEDLRFSGASTGSDSPFSWIAGFHTPKKNNYIYRGLDLPPAGILEILDLYYPSKLHQLYFMVSTDFEA
jgi:hypothetical protein